MKAVLVFAISWLMGISSGAIAQSTESKPACSLHPLARLDMQTAPDGRVTIPITIEKRDYNFLVDTGGYINTVSHEVVRDQGYTPRRVGGALRGMGTTYLDHVITVKDF